MTKWEVIRLTFGTEPPARAEYDGAWEPFAVTADQGIEAAAFVYWRRKVITMGLAAILASNIVGWWTLGLAIPFAEANPLNSHGRQNPVCTSPANQKEAP